MKRHKYIFISEYAKSGMKHLGTFEISGFHSSLQEAQASTSSIDSKLIRVLKIQRTPERLYLLPLVKTLRLLKYRFILWKRK